MSRERVCDACGAGIGKPCLTGRGRPALKDHAIRVRGGTRRTPEYIIKHRTYQREKYRRANGLPIDDK